MVIARRCCHIRKATQLAFFGRRCRRNIQALAVFAKNCGMWVDRDALDETAALREMKVVLVGYFFGRRCVATSSVAEKLMSK